jgi:Mu transposase-like protein
MATIADVRIHGTTHERPLDRFAQERAALVPTGGQPSFRLEAPLARIVADDWLVSVDSNRYSVPFTPIGQPVEVHRRNGTLRIVHRGGSSTGPLCGLCSTRKQSSGRYREMSRDAVALLLPRGARR